MSFVSSVGSAMMLQNRDVDLRVGLKNRMPGKDKKTQQSKREHRERRKPPALSFSRCFLQLLFGPDAIRIQLQRLW